MNNLDILQQIDIDLSKNKTQSIKVSKLKNILKTAKLFKHSHLFFLNGEIVLGNNKDITFKHDYKGDNLTYHISDIERMLQVTKEYNLKHLFLLVENNTTYINISVKDFIQL